MKKLLISILLFILLLPCVVSAEERLTITYDSNDGTGRSKNITYEKGESYTLAKNDIFIPLDNDIDDPMDDKIITSWCINSDCSDFRPSDYLTGNSYSYPSLVSAIESDNLTLYANWDFRKDISNQLNSIEVTGEAVSQDENGEYIIENYKDFEIKFTFKEKGMYGIGQYSYFKLPEYFTKIIYDSSKKQLEKPSNLPIRIRNGNIYNGSFFIKDNILFINFLSDNSLDSRFLFDGYLNFNIRYSVSYTKKIINGRELYAATTVIMCNNNEETKNIIESYPTGKIKIYYVDIDTNKEIYNPKQEEEILGTSFKINPIEIKDYKFVESSIQNNIEFEEEQQTIYYKYRKKESTDMTNTLKNPNTGIGVNIVISIIILLLSSNLYLIIKKNKKCILK